MGFKCKVPPFKGYTGMKIGCNCISVGFGVKPLSLNDFYRSIPQAGADPPPTTLTSLPPYYIILYYIIGWDGPLLPSFLSPEHPVHPEHPEQTEVY